MHQKIPQCQTLQKNIKQMHFSFRNSSMRSLTSMIASSGISSGTDSTHCSLYGTRGAILDADTMVGPAEKGIDLMTPLLSHSGLSRVLDEDSSSGTTSSWGSTLTRQVLGGVSMTSSAILKIASKLISQFFTSCFSFFCRHWLLSWKHNIPTGYPA